MPFAALLIPFVAWLAIFALPALSQTSTATHGSTGIKGFIDSIIHSKPLSDLFGLANKAVRFVVSKFAGAQLTHATAYLNTMTSLWKQTYRAQQAEAEATSSFAAAVEQAIPREARKAAHPALVRSRTALKHADHANAHAGAVGHALNAFKSRVNPRIAHATHAVDVTLPRDIARVRSREEALSRDQARLRERTNALEDGALDLWKWIRTHPLSATTGVFAGAVAIALGRLGLGGLRCRNFTNLLKREGCGFGTLLGRLLPLAALL
ncbi:MAG TPA: hypothetical protein VKA83_07805, partial [Methylomirabilota bacterium]|nr:hypothetical protein [Methylomirabilota bacterium]